MEYLTVEVHKEFAKRMEEEHHRINHRVGDLETEVKEIGKIASSVEKLANNMSNMLKEQKQHGELLEKQSEQIASMQKKQPEDTWTRIKSKALDTCVTVIMNALVIGLMLLAVNYVR